MSRTNIIFLVWVCFFSGAIPGLAMEFSYTLGLETTHFFTDSGLNEESSSSYGISFESEFDAELIENKINFQFTPFARGDSEDDNREHADIRELHLLYYKAEWEVLVGISKVFWGAQNPNILST